MNCIIIHGCPDDDKDPTYDKHWIPWTKQELIKKGILAETPLMPEPWKPKYEAFKEEFEKRNINENTILVGHSCGAAFLVRWLGETKAKVAKLILVAPWKINEERDAYKDAFYSYEIDKTIPNRVSKIVMFTADNEYEEGKKSLEIFHRAIGGKIIEIKGYRHYTQRSMGTEEFPELVKEITEKDLNDR